jgi:hypothetical protein
MALTTPDWLARHGGELRPSVGGRSWIVWFDDAPQYRLDPVPVRGKHSCAIIQTINGSSIPTTSISDSIEDAVRGGLEDLRKALGW